jgi:hypothetical protein
MPLEIRMEGLKNQKELSYDPSIILPGIYPKESKSTHNKDT